MTTLLICLTLIILCPTILLTYLAVKVIKHFSDVNKHLIGFEQVSRPITDITLSGKPLEHELDLTDEEIEAMLGEGEAEVISSHVAERHAEYDEKIALLKAQVEAEKAKRPGVLYEEDAMEVLARYIPEPKEEYAR